MWGFVLFPIPRTPWEWALVVLLLTAFWTRSAGWPLWLGLFCVFFFGPKAYRLLWESWRKARVAARAGGVGRRPGASYCPECGSELGRGAASSPVPHEACPACEGKWCSATSLAEASARRKKPLAWAKDHAAAGGPPCPRCAAAMEPGMVPGNSLRIFRCAACDGYWLSRMDWVGLELAL